MSVPSHFAICSLYVQFPNHVSLHKTGQFSDFHSGLRFSLDPITTNNHLDYQYDSSNKVLAVLLLRDIRLHNEAFLSQILFIKYNIFQYKDGQHMIAITLLKGTKYNCNEAHNGDLI